MRAEFLRRPEINRSSKPLPRPFAARMVASLLDVDPGRSTHRTVYTFVGDPQAWSKVPWRRPALRRKLIDMRQHQGEHPRIGALDVCPFVPVSGVSMAECVAIAEEFGRRLAEELQVPVYLYEEAARQEYRRRLADIRDGEYEGLAKKVDRWPLAARFRPCRLCSRLGCNRYRGAGCFSLPLMSIFLAPRTRPTASLSTCGKPVAAMISRAVSRPFRAWAGM